MNEDRAVPARQDHRTGTIRTWIGLVASALDLGEIAELRRISPERPSGSTFWRLVAALDPGPDRLESERRWAVALRTIAQLRGLHQARAPLGRALAEARLHDHRLLRLLRARGRSLDHELRTTSHFLASRSAKVDVTKLLSLVLSDSRPWEEEVRRRIARDYYRGVALQEQAKNEEES